jgi:hypothetical protein
MVCDFCEECPAASGEFHPNWLDPIMAVIILDSCVCIRVTAKFGKTSK